MDLSTAVSAMMPGSGAVACPVCTLYLREGISLQKHLDTHPKEQVIEALIRASSGGASGAAAANLGSSSQTPAPAPSTPLPTTSPVPPAVHSQQHNPMSAPSPSPHVPPQAQSPYPIGPIFECPPMNTMVPPQFASFSYQQFVNNGEYFVLPFRHYKEHTSINYIISKEYFIYLLVFICVYN